MDKEKEIEDFGYCIRDAHVHIAGTNSELPMKVYQGIAKELLKKAYGYRKADEVRKETAKEILQAMNEKMNMLTGCGVPYHVKQFMKEIAMQYGVEVDE